jgi:hypothetical protein
MSGELPPPGDDPGARLDNGLIAAAYVPLTDLAAPLAAPVLTALGRARIAAYLANTPGDETVLRLHVAAEERADARTIVAAVIRSAGAGDPASVADDPADADPLAGIDTDAAFAALVADWHVDTHRAVRDAEHALSQEDEDWRARLEQPDAGPTWLDDDHYVPPTPPPLPRFAGPTILAMVVLALSVLLLALGGELGLDLRFTLLLGVTGVLVSAGILIMRLGEHHDEDDDGAVI